ncbi:MAG: hypothetical protein ACRDE8_09155, partial [Ginsengibacter sp.]
MKKIIFLLPLAILFVSNTNAQRTHTLFDASWKFYRGDVSNGENENFNDKSWRTLDLPHDWSIE